MTKLTKIFSAILLSAFLLLGLAACGSDSEAEEETKEETKEVVEDTEPEEKKEYVGETDEEIQEREDKQAKRAKEENEEEVEEEEEIEEVDTEEVDESENNTSDIEWDVEGVVDADLDDTSITDIRINEDLSVDEERYIALVDLEWDVQNGAKTTKEMLDMYSDHLAAKLSDDKLIHELVLFWTVPYHNEDDSILKKTYENKEDGMFLEDEMKDNNVFD